METVLNWAHAYVKLCPSPSLSASLAASLSLRKPVRHLFWLHDSMLMPHPTIAAVSSRRQSNFELALVLRNSNSNNKNRSYNNNNSKLKLTMKPVARQHQFMISTNKLELLNIFMSRGSIWIPLWSSHNPVTVTAPVATWSQGEGERGRDDLTTLTKNTNLHVFAAWTWLSCHLNV